MPDRLSLPSSDPAVKQVLLYRNEMLSPQDQFIIADLDAGHLVVKTSEVETIEQELTNEVRLLSLSACFLSRAGWKGSGARQANSSLDCSCDVSPSSRRIITTRVRSTERAQTSVEAILYHMLVLCVGGKSSLSIGQPLVSGASLSQSSSRLVVLSSCGLHNPIARPPARPPSSIGPRPREATEIPVGVLCDSSGRVAF